MSSSEDDMGFTPDIINQETKTGKNHLPPHSSERYLKAYESFMSWRRLKGVTSFSESVFLIYFDELSKKFQPSSLWSLYSMLKCTMSAKHDINIKDFTNVSSLLKRLADGFKSKKSKVLTSDNVETFLNDAPDDRYLATKVVLIFGISGACRSVELGNITIENVERHNKLLLVKLPDRQTKKERSFIIRQDFIDIVQRYQALRPDNVQTNRFFLNYQHGKCTKQVIGKNNFGRMPKEIAKYLKLPNADLYTGHCFRRTAATLLTDTGPNIKKLKRSCRVAELCPEDEIRNKCQKIACKIIQTINLSPNEHVQCQTAPMNCIPNLRRETETILKVEMQKCISPQLSPLFEYQVIQQCESQDMVPLSVETLTKFRNDFHTDPKNELAQNVCTRFDPFEVAIKRQADTSLHVYNIKVESEGKPVTNQENSGRCWLFAALNVMRLPFMKKYGIEEFEFSQSYLFFWDKVERSHYWLNSIVTTARQGEALEGRLVNFLLKDPINDGGQWDMIVNLVNKYGLMPKKCFPESFSSKRSLHMNALIKTKLREYAKELRDMVASNASDDEIQSAITKQIAVIYNIVATCLGTPPQKFVFEFYNKEKAYNKFGPLTPQEFYETHVRPLFNVDDKVCLVNDPRASNPFGQLYTLHCLGNVVGGRQTAYNNQPIETLMRVVKESIQGGEAVWFGCEVSKRFERKNGLEDLDAQDYRLVFNTEVQIGLPKADRLLYGDSCMTHAMVFTAVGTDEEGNPKKFRVENSYSDKEYDKGYLLLTEPWFREFVFEVVVDKKYVPEEVLEVFTQEPKVLPAWDPMGTLACPLCFKE